MLDIQRKRGRPKLESGKHKSDLDGLTNEKRWRLKAYYCLTPLDFNLLLKLQNNRCAICRQKFQGTNYPYVDHNHKTKKVRGLLCLRCNMALGQLKDDIELMRNAIRYLEGVGFD